MSAATACLPHTMPPPSLSHHRPADDEQLTTGATAARIQDDDVGCKPRATVRTLACQRKQVGEGFALWRSIGRTDLPELDPFLSFDEFELSPPAGFLDHPHRGFESVTYMLEGGFSYHDFSGHKGTINTGDVQWMTAGRGVVHAEMPGSEGVHRGISIWINLYSKEKMVQPMYQDTASDDILVA